MKEVWTGDVVRQMHIHEISMRELADEIGWNEKYLCTVLNCRRKPKGAEEKCRAALERVVSDRNKEETE